MKDDNAPQLTAHLTTDQLAKYLNIPASTLKYFRCTGEGPQFLKLGRRVLYPMNAVNEWLESRLHRSTSSATK